ncbi:MAG: hypothetical protein FWD09_08230 [Lentimicrobiaceae bacterium]|nr:hypothetical protein [Lentimicrobiaceae bacterium]
MSIAFIEDGMELSTIREILNTVIQQVNQGQQAPVSFYDLRDRPCINGVELTENTTAQQLNLTLSQLHNVQEIEGLIAQVGESKARETARNELGMKLDSDFSKLPALRYNFNEKMLLSINAGNENYKATIFDLVLYLKYLILQDATFEKLVPKKTEDLPVGETPVGGTPIEDEKPIIETP